jgi:DNA-binding XRE family transcriptional regulator
MLRLLRLRIASGVVIHKIDRSARNLEDWNDIGKLVDAGVDVHLATESIDLTTTAGRLSADIQAVVATHYSRNLREEVKKGLYGRLKQGFYPLRAPVGYLDQGAAQPKIHDPNRGPLVRAAFELYAAGEYSLPQLAKEMFRQGLRNRNGGRMTVGGIAKLLTIENVDRPLGTYLRTHRKHAGLTQGELARIIGYPSAATISNHERLYALPPLMTAIAYEVVFRVPVTEIFAGVAQAMEQLVDFHLTEMEKQLRNEAVRGAHAQLVLRKIEWLEERRASVQRDHTA